MTDFLATCYLISPLLLGLTAHGVCIRFGWLRGLTFPVDGGLELRGKRLLGENKTARGLFATGLGTAVGFGLQAFIFHQFAVVRQIELFDYAWPWTAALGFLVGVAAMMGEFPNSFVKRQLTISPGTSTNGFLGAVFYIFDQVDLLIGAWAILAFVVDISLIRIVYSCIFLFFSHQIISLLGFWLGMRKTAR